MECRAIRAAVVAACLLAGGASVVLAGTRNFGSTGGGTGGSGGGGEDNRAEITITESRPIQFGRVVTSALGGSITLSPDGLVSTTSGVDELDTPQEGVFDLTGEPGADFSVTLQFGGVMTSNGQSIGVLSDATPSYTLGQFDGTGAAQLRVGALLTLTGVSTGVEGSASYTIDVDYTN